MKKLLLRIVILTSALLTCVAALTSCDILFSLLLGSGCSHEDINLGNCTERAYCNICGETVADFGDHEYVAVSVEPTCLKEGKSSLRCRLCGETKNGSTVPALGHSFGEWEISVHPTATATGKKDRECKRCGVVETESVIAHNHYIVYEEARAVDCEHDGWAEHEYCTVCEYNNKVVIKATGHAYGEYTSNGNGTHTAICENNSSHVSTEPCSGSTLSADLLPICSVCGSEYEIAVRPGNSTYGYYALGTYPFGDEMQTLYRDLTTACELFYASDDTVLPDGGRYVIGKFNVNDYSLSVDQAMAVWKIFYVSNPAYYWLDAAVVAIGDTVLLTIADSYASPSYRAYCDEEIASMTRECEKLIDDGMSDLERAATITAYIVTNMEYAYESDGETPVSDMWAHNMSGFAVNGLGVCEAYAKSFMYLCLLNGVDCIAGSGYADGEPHAWNYVKLGDEWYGADLTWTDSCGDVAVYDYFGLSADSIYADHKSHPSAPYGVEFIYEAPELAKEDIELTALYENGELAGLFADMDAAFNEATDHAAEYIVDIGYYSPGVSGRAHTLDAIITPAVKKLTIIGKNEYVGEMYMDNNSVIHIRSTLTLRSELVLQDVELANEKSNVYTVIKLSTYSLVLSGKSVYVHARVEGGVHTSSLVASTVRGAYVYGGADIYRLRITSNKIVFGSDSRIDYSNSREIYVTNNADVTVVRYENK